MRKRVVSLAFVFTMALGVVAGPTQVTVAAPAEPAVCVAENITTVTGTLGGQFLSAVIVVPDAHGAEDGEVGAGGFIAPRASNDDCTPGP